MPDDNLASVHQAEQLEFFERKIRPVLVEQCYACHAAGARKLQSGLLLDSRQGILDGGDTGPAAIPGKPEESLLIEALKHTSLEMPPDKQLDDQVIADFETWIRNGLVDPRQASAESSLPPRVLYSADDAQSHWAFQPIAAPTVPALDDPWIRTPIDAFVLARLRDVGLEPSPAAEPEELLRRSTYDLTGLPPSSDQVHTFLAEPSTRVFSQRVDQLLDSTRYGEKWGRHWLDIARYADTNGQRPAPTLDAPFYPFAWMYRDYVIDALNRDLPFDRFILEQIAGDALATPSDKKPWAALGFLRVGRTFGGNEDDRIDDRIDAVTKAFLGLTVACARCHDHKLDPIYQEDYYALHGVFSSSEDIEQLYRDTRGTPAYEDFAQKQQRLRAEIETECLAGLNDFMHSLTTQVAEYMVGAELYRDGVLGDQPTTIAARKVDLLPIPFQSWLDAMQRWEDKDVPAYRPWFRLANLNDQEFHDQAPSIVQQIAGGNLDGDAIPNFVAKHFQYSLPQSLREVAEVYQDIFLEIEDLAGGRYPMSALLCAMEESPGAFRPEYFQHPALPTPLEDQELEALRSLTLGFEGPYFMTPRQLMQAGASGPRKAMVRRKHELVQLEAEHPGAPIRVMAVRDRTSPVDSPIFIRGDRSLPGDIAPRRFLRHLSNTPQPFTQGSGRLELARAIASEDNPLTARVIVNRVWQWHFGRGLVATPSDFGLNAEPPTHPELLDWLATWFIEQGWSLKQLHRLIMNSSVYQQSSLVRAEPFELDSENRWLWRMNPRRMTFEEIRDTWLTASGELQAELGGRPCDPLRDTSRRSVYLQVDRYRLPGWFTTFDFANPEFTTATRDATIVPQQALFVMNSPWLTERARELATRAALNAPVEQRGQTEQIQRLFAILYQRRPNEHELEIGRQYVDSFPDGEKNTAYQRLAHALLQANETLYIP